MAAGWRNLKRRLPFTYCCTTAQVTIISDPEEAELIDSRQPIPAAAATTEEGGGGWDPAAMNLATALAAERNSRDGSGGGDGKVVKTLMRLIEETDGGDRRTAAASGETEEGSDGGGKRGGDWVCCVCMERDKGAAFIPCGHTFCRVCSRDLLGRRGCCPVCNRPILKILDIF